MSGEPSVALEQYTADFVPRWMQDWLQDSGGGTFFGVLRRCENGICIIVVIFLFVAGRDTSV